MNDLDGIEVLLVEDNPHDAEMTMRALRKGNFLNKLHWVKDGVEALDFIRCSDAYAGRTPTENLKLVLLDLKMPRMNGIEVLREIKADPNTHDIPIVMMTSSSQERDVVESYQLGANGFVTKPINVTSFMEAVAQIGMYWLLVNQSTSR